MKARRVINVILSALLVITLCFCMFGCTPSEEEIEKKELESYKISAKAEIDNWHQAVLTKDETERTQIDSYFALPYCFCDEYMTDYVSYLIGDFKKQVEYSVSINAIDEILKVNKEKLVRELRNYGLNIRVNYAARYSVIGETDGMRFEIGETDSPLSSPAGTCKFILSGRDIEVAAVLENHVWDGGESIVVVTGDGSSKISYYGTHRYYDHSGESCYKYFIIKFNGKIGGYIIRVCKFCGN